MPDPMFLAELAPQPSQGDIIDKIELTEAWETPPSSLKRVVILSNDCDIDKPKQKSLIIAAVQPVSVLAGDKTGLLGLIRKGSVAAAMMLDSHVAVGDSFVDFRMVHSISRDDIVRAASDGRRLASMSEDGRLALLGRFAFYLGRRQTRQTKP